MFLDPPFALCREDATDLVAATALKRSRRLECAVTGFFLKSSSGSLTAIFLGQHTIREYPLSHRSVRSDLSRSTVQASQRTRERSPAEPSRSTVLPLCDKMRIIVVLRRTHFFFWRESMARQAALKIWVGTRKGAFAFTSKDRKKWECSGPIFAGQEVHHIAQDPRDPKRHYAAVGNAWFGPHLHASTDGGKTWQISEKGLEVK